MHNYIYRFIFLFLKMLLHINLLFDRNQLQKKYTSHVPTYKGITNGTINVEWLKAKKKQVHLLLLKNDQKLHLQKKENRYYISTSKVQGDERMTSQNTWKQMWKTLIFYFYICMVTDVLIEISNNSKMHFHSLRKPSLWNCTSKKYFCYSVQCQSIKHGSKLQPIILHSNKVMDLKMDILL